MILDAATPRVFGCATLAALSCACFVAPEAPIGVETDLALAGRHVRRGMTQNERPVLRPGMRIVLPVDEKASLLLDARGALNLKSDTGDAWLPSGHRGELSELDLGVVYVRTVGPVDLATGLLSHSLPNGSQFPRSSERGGTGELFVSATTEAPYELLPRVALHVDFDEAEGFYLLGEVTRVVDLDPNLETVLPEEELGRWSAILQATLGLSDGGHSEWAYGFESTSTDFKASGTLEYLWDDHTRLFLSLTWSTILDSTMKEWFDTIAIDAEVSWLELGMSWGI